MKILILFMVVITLICCTNKPYHKVVHVTDANAKCLDGSPGFLYLSQGDPQHILMYFMGGASCGATSLSATIQSCYQRSRTLLGSSLYWPKQNQFQGILSNDPSNNIFANWTKAVFIYCDGAFHQGNNKDPLKYKDTQLYFRGGVITRSHLKYLDSRFPFANAKKVVLSGSSAGGMATYIWADHVKAMVGKQTQYFSVPDSSIFLDPQKPLSKKIFEDEPTPTQTLLSITNKDEDVPNSACSKALGKQNEFKCLDIYSAYHYLESESLFVQSSYDQYLLRYFAKFTCIEEGTSGFTFKNCDTVTMAIVQDYRAYYLLFLQKLLEKGHNIWTISCCWHAMAIFDKFYESPLQKVPQTSGLTMQQAIYKFVFQKNKVVQIDLDRWPDNAACAY